MSNENPRPMTKVRDRKLQLERAARARATITSYLNGVDAPYVTFDALATACADIKGADISNVVSRMAKNNLLTEIRLDKPVGRYKVGYALPRGMPGGELPLPPPRAKRKYMRGLEPRLAGGKPTVVVTDKDITVDYPHMRVIIQVVPT